MIHPRYIFLFCCLATLGYTLYITVDLTSEPTVIEPYCYDGDKDEDGRELYHSFAMFEGAEATGSHGIAIGKKSIAGKDALAFGDGAEAPFLGSIAIGPGAKATRDHEIVVTVKHWPSFIFGMVRSIQNTLVGIARPFMCDPSEKEKKQQ